MATSDGLRKEKKENRSRYLVAGAGGILFILPIGTLYDEKMEEEIAFSNASKIQCTLYRKTVYNDYSRVIAPGKYEEVDRKMIVRTSIMNREMLNNNNYVEGIQINAHR